MNREERRLHNQKSTTNVVGTTVPSPSEGANGDITVRNIGGTIRLYAKYANRWYKVNLS